MSGAQQMSSGDFFAMAALLAACFAACSLQALKICRSVSGGRDSRPSMALDAGILAHLVILCLCLRCFEEGAGSLGLAGGVAFPVSELLWANVAVAVLAVFSAVADKRPARLAAVVPLAATLPACLASCGRWWPLACGLDLVFFALRLVQPYLSGRRWGGQGVLAASPAEVLNLLPHGVLCASASGRVQLLNATMREILVDCGLGTDLSDARAMLAELAPAEPGGQREVRLDDGRPFLVSVDDECLRRPGWRCVIAYDVTEEERLNRELERANAELREQNRELARLLRNILWSAARAAHLQMRGAVHDIVGQRLSILHRHIEDGALDDATLAQVRPLLAGLLEDLRPAPGVSPASELSALVDAFGAAGVAVEVEGLPAAGVRLGARAGGAQGGGADDGVARLQVRIVREALTNALRHGHARHVQVVLGGNPARAMVEVSNDGACADGAIIEGNGLSGLRRAVEARGGSFSVEGSPRFRVRAEVPRAAQAPCADGPEGRGGGAR